jgi:hypothetical protein
MAYNACHAALLARFAAASLDLPLGWEAVAGGAAGAAQTLVACPLEAAKIPMQCAEGGGERPKLAAILAELGPAGLFNGVEVCLLRDILSGATFFAAFAAAKHTLGAALGPEEAASAAFALKLAAGAIAGVPCAILTTPLDVVKTRLQAQGPERVGPATSATPRYANAAECAVRTVAEEGWGALLSGAGARVARLSPQLGITLALYEVLDPVR